MPRTQRATGRAADEAAETLEEIHQIGRVVDASLADNLVTRSERDQIDEAVRDASLAAAKTETSCSLADAACGLIGGLLHTMAITETIDRKYHELRADQLALRPVAAL